MISSNVAGLGPAFLPAVLATAVAAGAGLLLRGRRGQWVAAAGAAAVLAGWWLAGPWLAAGDVRMVLWPRRLLDHLVLPALVFVAVAGISVRATAGQARWLGVGAVLFGAWWLAGSGPARPEFWRVWFAVAAGAWALGRMGAGQGKRALASGVTLWGGLAAAGAASGSAGVAVASVLTGAAAGISVAGVAGVLPAGLLALGIVAVDLVAGRLVPGSVGFVDIVCAVAFVVPALGGWAERGLVRRVGRAGVFAAPVVLGAGGVGLAWVIARVLRV